MAATSKEENTHTFPRGRRGLQSAFKTQACTTTNTYIKAGCTPTSPQFHHPHTDPILHLQKRNTLQRSFKGGMMTRMGTQTTSHKMILTPSLSYIHPNLLPLKALHGTMRSLKGHPHAIKWSSIGKGPNKVSYLKL